MFVVPALLFVTHYAALTVTYTLSLHDALPIFAEMPGAMPVPERVTFATGALLVTVKVALSAAGVEGVNTMPTTPLAPGATVFGYVTALASAKSAALVPVKPKLVITRFAVPGLL